MSRNITTPLNYCGSVSWYLHSQKHSKRVKGHPNINAVNCDKCVCIHSEFWKDAWIIIMDNGLSMYNTKWKPVSYFVGWRNDRGVNSGEIHSPASNNSFGSFWFSMVLVGNGFNCLASESLLCPFHKKLRIWWKKSLGFCQTDNPRFRCIMYCYI